MSAATATTALAAGVGTFGTVLDAPGGAQRCTRKPLSTWTSCTCARCMRLRRRNEHLAKTGRLKRFPAQAAWAQIDALLEQGWDQVAIADAAGVEVSMLQVAIGRRRRGGPPQRFGSLIARGIAHADPARDALSGTRRVTGTRRRLEALALAGWSMVAIRDQTGLSLGVLSQAAGGVHGKVSVHTWRAIRDFYRVAPTPGPAPVATRRAKSRGFAPAAAWDDETIEDPEAQPEGLEGSGPRTVDQLVLDRVRELVAAGLSDSQIGLDIGLTDSGVQKLRGRYGITRRAAA